MLWGNTVFWAIIVLGALIFVHELGHFLVAKRLRIGVEKFSLGFGPPLWAFRRGETQYQVAAVPLGGYVKLMGEDPEQEVEVPEKSFSLRPVRERLAVVLAGPLFNIFFAVLLFWVLNMVGVPTLGTTILRTEPGSPAEAAGLKEGDKIIAIDAEAVETWEEMAAIIRRSGGRNLNFLVLRQGRELSFTIVPRMTSRRDLFGEMREVPLIGVIAGRELILKRAGPVRALGRGFLQSYQMVRLTVTAIWKILNRTLSTQTLGGPLLIAKMAGESAQRGLLYLVSFVALLSINLGIINLFPIPILDGGHLIFLAIEAVAGRPLSVRKREMAQQIGLMVIVSLMFFVFYNDIIRIFLR
ncbi:MAG: RIP metalloprotease RseP [Nitrospinota bacterium]